MGNRLSKIYTRTGDKGTTGIGDNSRVAKDDLRIEVIGTVDELNSVIGLITADQQLLPSIQQSLTRIQHDLFDLGGELSIPGTIVISADRVKRLEAELDAFNADLPYLKEFILPGGHPTAASCHLARTICRRAERRMVSLTKQDNINSESLIYLNRLSDLLFVIARVINKFYHHPEIFWQHQKPPSS